MGKIFVAMIFLFFAFQIIAQDSLKKINPYAPIVVERPYTSGKIDGVVKYYYKNGSTEKEIPYIQGKINGIVKNYYENGNLKQETPFSNNRINGTVKHYNEKGILVSVTFFVNGKMK